MPHLHQFSQLANVTRKDKQVDYSLKQLHRFSSHKDVYPTKDFFHTFVTPRAAEGELIDRCKDMRDMSIQEQSANIHYLLIFKRVYEIMDTFRGNGAISGHAAFVQLQKSLDEDILAAQRLHREKFGMRR